MLLEKEVIAPGTYWYTDEKTGLPRKLDVDASMTKWWQGQGTAMLSSGLTVPVPYEHDFGMHPMTSADKLLSNAGDVKEYKLKSFIDEKRGQVKDALFAVVDIKDKRAKDKIGDGTIMWTSPWINSFMDGKGKQWTNVISHLALTTRPRIIDQKPFDGVAAALSLANSSSFKMDVAAKDDKGFCLSRAGLLNTSNGQIEPVYPIAFSIWSGVSLGGAPPFAKGGKDKSKPGAGDKPTPDKEGKEGKEGSAGEGTEGEGGEGQVDSSVTDGKVDEDNLSSLRDPTGDIAMEELLCDLLSALGIHLPEATGETEFKRHLYEAAMLKIKELTGKGLQGGQDPTKMAEEAKKTGDQKSQQMGKQNPLVGQVQQEQQPMYMSTNMSNDTPALSLEEINKLPDPTKSVALAMYADNQRLRAQLSATEKTTNGLRDAKLREATAGRLTRCTMLGRMLPSAKTDLDAMLALPSMAMSLGDDGNVVDPMAQILNILDKSVANIPTLLKTPGASLAVHPQPTDESAMTAEREEELVNSMARMMGCPPEKKAS